MRCFTDEELTRGIDEVLRVFNDGLFGLMTPPDWREVFLTAARSSEVVHPMTCTVCARVLTTPDGIALVAITITDRWRCATCRP